MAVILREERIIDGTPLTLKVFRPSGRLTKADRERAERLDAELAVRIPELAHKIAQADHGLIRQRWIFGKGLREITSDRTLVKQSDLAAGHLWEAIWFYLPRELRPNPSADAGSYSEKEDRRKGFFSLCYEISGYRWTEINWINRWHDWYEIASRPGLTRDPRVLQALAREVRSLPKYPSSKRFQEIVKSLASAFPTVQMRDSSLLDDKAISETVNRAVILSGE